MNILEFVSQPWHWAVSGIGIGLVMFLLLIFGQKFGISTSYQAICSMSGAGKKVPFFNDNWKQHNWLMIFIVGSVIGGVIASSVLQSPEPVAISEATIADLRELNIVYPQATQVGKGFIPEELFNFHSLVTIKGFILLVVGGFFIGFGTRWAGGCTSGHAITGLSMIQLPSLVAVIGFFIGGLAMTHILLPIILNL